MAKKILSGSIRRSMFGKLPGVQYFIVALIVHCIISFGIATPAMAASCASASSGMLSWWGGDNNTQDIMGTHHGTLAGGTTYAPGLVGQAFSFNGQSGYIATEDSTIWDLGTGDFTIQGWINTNTPSSIMRLVSAGSHTDGANNLWTFGYGSAVAWGGPSLNFAYYHGSGYVDLSSAPITINAGSWHHIAVVRAGASLLFYFDGNPSGAADVGSVSLGGGSTGVIIGARYLNNAQDIIEYAEGLVDEIGLFRRALSPSEVASIFNAGSAGVCRPCAPIPAGALSLWKAEDNANDSIGTNNGTLQNGLTFAPGKVGRAFSLDGVNDYVSFGNILDMGANNFSVSVWINAAEFRDDLGAGTKVINKGLTSSGTPSNSGYGIRLVNEGGINKARFMLLQGDTVGKADAVNLQANQWYHLVGVREGTAIRIYLNGIVANATTSTGVLDTSTNVHFAVGALYRQPTDNAITEYFKGLIDEPAMYDRALTESEVVALYNAGSTGTCYPGLVSWWKAENNGLDSAGSNHGALQGPPAFAPGAVGQTFSFDGVDDFVQLTDSSTLKPTAALSVGAWINMASSPSGNAMIVDHESADPWYGYGLYVSSGNVLHADIYSDTPSAQQDLAGQTVLQPDVWYHAAMTYDGTNIKLYLNGMEDGSLAATGPINYTQSVNPTIGKRSTGNTSYFHGMMDEVQLFNRALSADEVGLLFWGEYMVQRISGGQNYYYVTPQSAYAAPAVTGDELRMKVSLFGPMTFDTGVSLKLAGGYCLGSLFTDNSCGMTLIGPQLIIGSDSIEIDKVEVR